MVNAILKPFRFKSVPYEYKVISLKEVCSNALASCENPEMAQNYWTTNVLNHPYYNAEVECLVVLILNAKRKIKGHYLVSVGILDTVLSHPREIFRLAIVTSASSIVLMHNHPSGDPCPSESDVLMTRGIIRAGQLLKIELIDHIIMGNPNCVSMKGMGYFNNY
jgi:DNA repair protein RadC